MSANTVTVKEARMVPGKGYQLVSTTGSVFRSTRQADAQAEYDRLVTFWKTDAEVVEQDGTTVEIQVGAWRRVMVELS